MGVLCDLGAKQGVVEWESYDNVWFVKKPHSNHQDRHMPPYALHAWAGLEVKMIYRIITINDRNAGEEPPFQSVIEFLKQRIAHAEQRKADFITIQ